MKETLEEKLARSSMDEIALIIRNLAKSKQAAYTERNQLVAFISKLFPSHLCRHPDNDKEWENDWRWIVCIHSPHGQLTWHIHDGEKKHFNHLKVKTEHWDGHTTPQKYAPPKNNPTLPNAHAISITPTIIARNS